MTMDMPPDLDKAQPAHTPPAYYAPGPECNYLTNTQAQEAFQRLRSRLPGTSFDNAKPSEVCGLVRVQLSSGKIVYTDPTGRFLLLALALDTHKGEPADASSELEIQLERRQTFPENPLPGIFKGSTP